MEPHPLSAKIAIKLILGTLSETEVEYLNTLDSETKTHVASDLYLTTGFMIPYTRSWSELIEQFGQPNNYYRFATGQGSLDRTRFLLQQLKIDDAVVV